MNRKGFLLALLTLASSVAAGSCNDETGIAPIPGFTGARFDAGFDGGALVTASSGLSSTGTFGVGGVGGSLGGPPSTASGLAGASSSTGPGFGFDAGP